MGSGFGHFTVLGEDECRELLRTEQVVRLGWQSSRGPQILPVTYRMFGDDLVFRTAPDALLAELAAGVRVAALVDGADTETRTGWSVLAQGDAAAPSAEESAALVAELPRPWARGDRSLVIRVRLDTFSGRVLAADD